MNAYYPLLNNEKRTGEIRKMGAGLVSRIYGVNGFGGCNT